MLSSDIFLKIYSGYGIKPQPDPQNGKKPGAPLETWVNIEDGNWDRTAESSVWLEESKI